MNIIDVIAGILLLYALWRGWNSGILVQLGGIAGVIAGAWLAFRFSEQVCHWFSLAPNFNWLAFVAILIVVMVVVIVLCRLMSKLLENVGLSLPIKLLGAVASTLKVLIIVALVMRTYENIDQRTNITGNSYLKQAYVYQPIQRVATLIFPYLTSMYSSVESETMKLTPAIQEAIDKEVERQLKEKSKQL